MPISRVRSTTLTNMMFIIPMTPTNRRMPAAEAHQRGLCVEVARDDEVVTKSLEYANRLADLSTDALVTTRRLIRGAVNLDFEDALDAERLEQGRLGKTPEHREGVNAFLEKRKPKFTGK